MCDVEKDARILKFNTVRDHILSVKRAYMKQVTVHLNVLHV